jgi:hypothetical protein
MDQIIRSLDGAVIDTSKKKRSVTAAWSTDETDHYRTAFVQSGIDLATYRDNPVICWEHRKSADRGALPIANAVEVGVDRYKGKNALIGTSRFWEDEFSEKRWQDYASGRLKGWSIGCLALDASPPTAAERRARPDWAQAELVYRSARLMEVSAVSIVGNASALTISVERSAGALDADIDRELAGLSEVLLVRLIAKATAKGGPHATAFIESVQRHLTRRRTVRSIGGPFGGARQRLAEYRSRGR